ncbi:MAG: basic amino acid ABC transporter substrate-binding protein [Thermoprotei archaeon]
MSRILLLAIAVVVIVLIGGIIYYFTAAQPPKKEILIVGTSPDFPPFEYIDEEGNVVGFDIDLIRLLAKKAGYKDIEIVTMDFDSLIPALTQGKIDVIAAGMTITEERKKVVDFTDPYWEADQAILVKKDGGFMPSSVDDLDGKTVGVQTGTTGADYIKNYAKEHGLNIIIKEYTSFVLAVQDLVAGRIDAVIVDSPVAKMFEQKYPVKIAVIIKTGEVYGFAVRKGDTELLQALNKALQEVKNSPEWNELIEKYFGTTK